MKKIVLYILVLNCIISCKKKKAAIMDPISDTPSIELVSVNTTSVKQFTDSLIFTIKFIDAGGDIGEANADSMNVVLTDTRNASLIEYYHIAPTAPDGQNINVQGQFRIVLKNTILLDATNTNESTTYKIKLKDRAAHWSNEVQSPTITIHQ